MLLERIVAQASLCEKEKQTLWLVIYQINLLLCYVSDLDNYRLILSNKFKLNIEVFSPIEVLQFVRKLFEPIAKK